VRPDVSIVVVTYKCRDEAAECLASIYERTHGVSFEVVVVENASGDGTAERLRNEFPAVKLVALEENIGFAAGVNRGVEEATGEYVLLLNPDSVVHEGAVPELVEFAGDNPGHGLYGGRTLWPDGTVCPGSCWGKPSLWSLFCFSTLLSTVFKGSRVFDPESLGGWQRDTVREVDIVTGCLLLAPREVWDVLGGFDERFFMYGEDGDLALRVARLGLRPIITPDAVITHEVGVSSATRSDKVVLLLKGKATLLHKHWPSGKRRVGLALLSLGVAVRAFGARIALRGKDSPWVPVWRARRDWLRGYAPRRPVSERQAELGGLTRMPGSR
jgi:N-acetylglucosaminyl-diphospho-decaprenol L-rhamnosyltransferase